MFCGRKLLISARFISGLRLFPEEGEIRDESGREQGLVCRPTKRFVASVGVMTCQSPMRNLSGRCESEDKGKMLNC